MRAAHTLFPILLLLTVMACDEGAPWGGPREPDAIETAPDFGPAAAFDRRLVFLGPGGTLPTAALFDFVALSDSIGLRRGVRARVVHGAGWRALMDAGWEMAPMREPWRLVPHGRLTMVVGEGGDLGSLIHRDSVTTRLQLGPALAEHSPDIGTQLRLRSARLVVNGDSVPGVLLDAQLGRAVNPAVVARDPAPATTGGTDDGPSLDTTEVADTATDISPTPIARPGSEALLLNNAGYYAVLAGASGGMLAWVRNAGQDNVRSGVRLEPTAWGEADETGAQVPAAWRIVSADGELRGELTAESTDPVALDGAGLQTLAYALVTGWIEDRSVRRNVFGLVRHVR